MTPEDFIKKYEKALGTQDWKNIDGLMHNNVSVTFSNGKVHLGKYNVQKAYEANFSLIKNEEYKICNINWVIKEATLSVYLFEFNWKGIINKKLVFGSGIGTSVIIKEDNIWKLVTEHLGKRIE